jgi:hypothetical protein
MWMVNKLIIELMVILTAEKAFMVFNFPTNTALMEAVLYSIVTAMIVDSLVGALVTVLIKKGL